MPDTPCRWKERRHFAAHNVQNFFPFAEYRIYRKHKIFNSIIMGVDEDDGAHNEYLARVAHHGGDTEQPRKYVRYGVGGGNRGGGGSRRGCRNHKKSER